MNHRVRVLVPMALVLSLVLSCSSSGTGTAPEFAVVAGDDGIALVGDDWFEKVDGIEAPDPSADGPLVAPIDATRAAVVTADRIAVVRAHEPATVQDCEDCVGVAVTDDYIVTSRRNSVANGFDLMLFDHDLADSRTVPAQRLEERVTTAYPAENTESPVTLAADEDRITVGYLARDGGNRRGPSIIAQYSFDGTPRDDTKVDGLIRRSAVSSDGNLLAVGVGGSGSSCSSSSEPVIVDLESLRARQIVPEVPGVPADADAWFWMTDMQWQPDELVVTGEVHHPPANELCDENPEIWQRTVDPRTGAPTDSGPHQVSSVRWVGPRCGDVLTVRGDSSAAVLSRGSGTRLGDYYQTDLGRPAPADCARP